VTETGCSPQLDLTFVVDSSGSINAAHPNNWNSGLVFINKVIDTLDIGPSAIQLAMVMFGTKAQVQFYLDDYTNKAELQAEVSLTPYLNGWTNLAAGLNLVWSKIYVAGSGTRPGVAKVAVIITDGADNKDTAYTVPEGEICRSKEIQLVAVGITDNVDKEKLMQIVSTPDNYFNVTDYASLSKLINSLSTYICKAVPPPPKGKVIVTILNERASIFFPR
jgi:uncharacterized protein YegL